MTESNGIEPRRRTELLASLEELAALMGDASATELAKIDEALGAVVRRVVADLPGRIERTEYDTVLAIGQLAIATRDAEAVARIVTGHDLGSPAESDPDLDGFGERFRRVDLGLVTGVRSGLRWLRGAAESLGAISTLRIQ
jgi:class 3 adenylate cyclase